MPAQYRIRNAVNEPRVFPDKRFENFISAPLGRRRSAQDRLSCQHPSPLNHEDRFQDDSVQEFLEEERRAGECLRYAGQVVIPKRRVWVLGACCSMTEKGGFLR